MGLIRNAIKQGVSAAEHAIKSCDHKGDYPKSHYGLLIVGAGPAGLAQHL